LLPQRARPRQRRGSYLADQLLEFTRRTLCLGLYYAEIRKNAAEACHQALGDAQFEAARQRGMALSFPEAIAVARNETKT
jgi:hypothetical protein